MKIPLFYSLATGQLRRWTVPADEKESELISLKPRDGEGVLVISEKEYGGYDTLQSLVSQASGLVPVIERYAVVDKVTGNVLTAIDTDAAAIVEGCDLIRHDKAREGWKLVGNTFVNLNIDVEPL